MTPVALAGLSGNAMAATINNTTPTAAGVVIPNGDALDNTSTITGPSGTPAVRSNNTDDVVSIYNHVGASITGTVSSAITIGYSTAPSFDLQPPTAGADLGTFTNDGMISAASTSWASALKVGGDVTSFTNRGSMTATNYDTVLIRGNVGTFLNEAGGTISAASDGAVSIGGTVGTFTNNGTIIQTATDPDEAVAISALTGTLTNNGTISANGGPAVRVNGNGGTSATIVNSGTVTSNQKAFQLTAQADTLTLMSGSTTSGVVDGGGASDLLKLDGTGTGSFAANQLLNFETISKLASGNWTLSGNNAATMTATIAAGRLAINGNMSATSITVTGGTLGGNGTVGTVAVSPGAAIAPGNSVGTLTTGNITFAAGSAYEVEVAGNVADLLSVVGSVTLNGAVTVNVNATAACGTLSAPIITTTGGFTGPGSFVLGTSPAGASLMLSGNNLLLGISGGTGRLFTGFTNTLNQARTAAALDAMGCGNQPYAAQLATLTDAQVPAAMDALSGEGHASFAAAMVENSQLIAGAASARLEQAFDKVDSSGAASGYAGLPNLLEPGAIDGLSVWGNGYGGVSSKASDGNAGPAQSFAGGFVMGVDGKVSEDWRLGLMAGLGTNAINAQSLTGTSLDGTLGAYAGGKIGVMRIKAGAAYTRHLISTSRSIIFPGVNDTVSASYQAGTAQAFLEVGADFDAGPVTVTPFVKLMGVNHAVDAFTETGGAGRLSTAASVTNALFVTLGVAAEDSFVLNDTMLVTARGSIGWRHAFADQAQAVNSFVGGGPMTIASAPLAGDVAVVTVGASTDISEDVSLDIAYEGSIGSGSFSSAVKVTLSGRF